MATVPIDEIPTVQAEPLPGRAYPRFDESATPAEFGYGIGAGLEHTGGMFMEKDKIAQEKATREANQVRIAQANTDLSNFATDQLYGPVDPKTGARDPANAAYAQHGDKAIALDDRYGPLFDQKAAEIRAGLANEEQRAAFDIHTANQKLEFHTGLARYQQEEFQRVRGQTFDAAASAATNQLALNWRGMADGKTYQDGKDNLLAIGDAMADAKRLDKRETQGALLDRALESVVGNALAEGGAQGVAFSNRFLDAHKDELSNPLLNGMLRERIDAKQKQLDAELKDGLRGKLDDAVQGVRAGVPGSEHLISNAELKVLFPHDWQQHRDYLTKVAAASASEAKFDQMSPAEIYSQLDSSDPRKNPAHAGQGNDIEAYNMTVTAAQRSIARRQADGREFAIRNYGDAPIDWSKDIGKAADIIQNRAALAQDDSRRLGVNMPLLSKVEAAQLSGALAAQPPDRQAGLLAQLRDSVGSEQTFRELVAQIRPNDPVIAEAALRLPRNPNNAPLWYDAHFDKNPQISQEILAGNDLLAPKGGMKAEEGKGGFKAGVAMPPDAQLRLQFDSHFPDVFQGNPVAADQTYAAFRALYAARIAKAGDVSGNVQVKIARQAAKDLAPEMDSHFAGKPVPVPAGMDRAVFPDRVRDAVAASLKSKGLDPKLFEGHGLLHEGRLGSGDYVVLGADGTNLAVYPGTNQPVRIHLDQQYRRSSAIVQQRPRTREFPVRSASTSAAPDYEADIPGARYPANNPADYAPAGT